MLTFNKNATTTNVMHILYNPGDLVWLKDPTIARQKLSHHCKGPFDECLGSTEEDPGVIYRVRYLLDQSNKTQVIH